MPAARCFGAHKIVEAERGAGVVAKIKFGEIAVHMFLAAMLIDAFHAAFED